MAGDSAWENVRYHYDIWAKPDENGFSLIAAIKEAIKEITPVDCQGWFRKAGYR